MCRVSCCEAIALPKLPADRPFPWASYRTGSSCWADGGGRCLNQPTFRPMGVLVMMIAASEAEAAAVEVQLGWSRTSCLGAVPRGDQPAPSAPTFLPIQKSRRGCASVSTLSYSIFTASPLCTMAALWRLVKNIDVVISLRA